MYQYNFTDFAREGEQITINESVYIRGMLPEHTHNFLEIFYVIEGRGVHVINGHELPVQAGELVVLGYGANHTFFPDEGETLKWINIDFVPEFIDGSMINEYNANEIIKLSVFRNLFFNPHNITFLQLSDKDGNYGALIRLMCDEYTRHRYGCIGCLKHYLIILLTKVFCDNMKTKRDSDARWLLQTVLDEISESIAEDGALSVSLEKFAQKVYMSPKSFSRLFRQKIGVGFSHYVQQKRIEKSCKLLSETDMPITSVMIEVGYCDAKTFYQLFKRVMGITPMQYRTKMREKGQTPDTT